jgi:hypothetical protein
MSKKKPIMLPRSKRIFAIQLLFSMSIMLLLGAYVWCIQVAYDDVLNNKKTLEERIWLPIYYACIVSAAGFSYDCAKTILYLSEATFKTFISHVCEAGIATFVLVFAMVGATFLIYYGSPTAAGLGALIYIIGLIAAWFMINSVSNAIEAAVKGDSKT